LDTKVLPIRVKREGKFDKNGIPAIVTQFEQIKANYGVKPDPSLFGFTSLGLAPGAAVTDNRLQHVVGYWNGTGLSNDPVEARALAAQGGTTSGTLWVWLLLAALVLACVIAWLVCRQRHRPGPAVGA